MPVFNIKADEFRALPIPFTNQDGSRPKLGSCYIKIDDLPTDTLKDWMKVNPRVPRLNDKNLLVGPVARGIITTLREDPNMMALKNNGITILASEVSFEKKSGGQGYVTFNFEDAEVHGIANGGHTLAAIHQVLSDPGVAPIGAYVRLHIYEGLDKELIPEIAEGLNRSLQVDDASLQNLQGTFDEIKASLKGKAGAGNIAYRQGDKKDVDVQYILAVMAMLDLNQYSDRKKYPQSVFGQPKSVLNKFAKETSEPKAGYKIILPHLHEILVLSDKLQKAMVACGKLNKHKVKNTKSDNRVASAPHKETRAFFDGGTIGGWIPLGWLYPAVAALRANIDREAWSKGEFKWLMDPVELIESTMDEICEVIRQEHEANKDKPAEVGRKEAAYRGCYGALMMELASKGKLTS